MKLDFFQGQKGTVDGPRTKFLREISRVCLVVPRFIPDFQPEFAEVTARAALDVMKLFERDFPAYFLFDVHATSNTITLCPPIVSDDLKHISFAPDDYHAAWRDECWPVEIVDCTAIAAITAVCPYPRGRKAMDGAGGKAGIVVTPANK